MNISFFKDSSLIFSHFYFTSPQGFGGQGAEQDPARGPRRPPGPPALVFPHLFVSTSNTDAMNMKLDFLGAI